MPAPASVSVVIPTRDRADRVRHTVASALAQRGVTVEVVVVDDGSRDATAQRLAELPNIRVVRHETSRGVAAARNAGIAATTAPWVALLDDDDLWAPDKLRRQLDAAEAAGADWAYAAAYTVDPWGRIIELDRGPAGDLLDALHAANPIPAGASNVIVRRAALDAAGGFDEALQHFADWDLWVRLAVRGAPAVIGEPLVSYVHHEGNMHGDAARSGLAELDALEARVRRTTGREIDRALMFQWAAYGEGASGRYWAAARIAAGAAIRFRSRDDARQAAVMALRGAGLFRDRGRRGAQAPPWATPVPLPGQPPHPPRPAWRRLAHRARRPTDPPRPPAR